eukprot:1150238-Pelagomonas_calceolata.AAC.2
MGVIMHLVVDGSACVVFFLIRVISPAIYVRNVQIIVINIVDSMARSFCLSELLGRVPIIPDFITLGKRVERVDGRGDDLSVYMK